MKTSAQITKSLRKEDAESNWWLIDAENQTLGRLATRTARLLRGKHKPSFTPHVDGGDFVVVVNAAKVVVTGAKLKQKMYTHYSGYPSGLKIKSLEVVLKTKPTEVIHHAVKGMIPKNKLGSRMITRLKIYAGPEHPHKAQMPELKEVV